MMTPGLKRLRAWIAGDNSRSQIGLAKMLGVSQPAVSQWLRGVSRPEGPHRVALERLAEIPADDWLTRRERRDLDATMRRIDAAPETPKSGTDG